MKFIVKFGICLSLSALSACETSTPVGNGCEWVDPVPRLELCKPGQQVTVDEGLVANCTALTRPVGDWLLELAAQGAKHCSW